MFPKGCELGTGDSLDCMTTGIESGAGLATGGGPVAVNGTGTEAEAMPAVGDTPWVLANELWDDDPFRDTDVMDAVGGGNGGGGGPKYDPVMVPVPEDLGNDDSLCILPAGMLIKPPLLLAVLLLLVFCVGLEPACATPTLEEHTTF